MNLKRIPNISENIFLLPVLFSIIFNVKLLTSPSIYLINLSIIILFLGAFVYYILRYSKSKLVNIDIFVSVLLLTLILARHSGQYYYSFSVKYVFLVLTYLSVLVLRKNGNLSTKNVAFVIGFGALISTFTAAGSINIYDISLKSRLSVADLGNFNCYGFFIGVAIISLCYYYSKSQNKNIFSTFILLVAVFQLFIYLLSTYSRGAYAALLIGIVFYFFVFGEIRLKYLVYIITFVSAVIFAGYLLIAPDIHEVTIQSEVLHSRFFGIYHMYEWSGRYGIYNSIFRDLINDPMAMLFGFGVGSFKYGYQYSAHSTFLEILYFFGIIGLCIFIWFLFIISISMRNIKGKAESAYLKSIFIMMLFSFIYDSYYGATQLGWIFPLYFGLIRSSAVVDDNETPI